VLTSSDPQASMRASYTFTAADAGAHTFAPALRTAGLQSITFQDLADGLSATRSGIRVNSAAFLALAVSGFPSTDTAGTSHAFTVTAVDAYGNTVSSYTGTVLFTSTDPQAALPGSYTFTAADAGTHAFSATFKTAGKQKLKAADAANAAASGTQSNITVSAAAPASLALAGLPNAVTAGTQHTLTVAAQDAYGNVVPGYTGTVQLTTSDAQASLRASYTFAPADAGRHTFAPTLKTAGLQWIAATDAANGLSGRLAGITVNPGAAAALAVTGFPSPVTAGTSHAFTVTARDAYGNIVNGYAGTIGFTSSDLLAALPSQYAFTALDAGTHAFSATLNTAGAQKLKAADAATPTIAGTESNIQVRVQRAATPAALANIASGTQSLPIPTGTATLASDMASVMSTIPQPAQAVTMPGGPIPIMLPHPGDPAQTVKMSVAGDQELLAIGTLDPSAELAPEHRGLRYQKARGQKHSDTHSK
jgi:hypothetical protein